MEIRIPFGRLARTLAGIGASSAALAIAPAVHAQAALPVISQVANIGLMLPASAGAIAGASCEFPGGIPTQIAFAPTQPAFSKAAAINGSGGMSALERMIQAQSGQPGADASKSTYGEIASLPASVSAIAPTAILGLVQCGGRASWSINDGLQARIPTVNPTEFLASKRVKIGKTNFDKEWRRVSKGSLSARWANRRLGELSGGKANTVAAVNAYANRTIRYAEDHDLWGQADYWANADTTFRLGKGDCEDIAIAKMQMLAALGIDRGDMILTLARDLVRHADHAVLIVKLDGRFVMLDNTTDQLIDASVSQDYRPVLSFGNTQKWLHGF